MNSTSSATSRAKPISWVTSEHGHAVAGEVAHDGEDFADAFGVQGAGGFVEQHDGGFHRQRAGDGHALLLAAGELGGVLVSAPLEADPGQQFLRLLAAGGAVLLLHQYRSGHDVAFGGHVGEQVELLEDHADAGALFGQPFGADGVVGVVLLEVAEVLSVDLQDAAVGGLQAVDTPQQGRFARSAGPDDAGDLPGRDGQVDVMQDLVTSEALAQLACDDRSVRVHSRDSLTVATRLAGPGLGRCGGAGSAVPGWSGRNGARSWTAARSVPAS